MKFIIIIVSVIFISNYSEAQKPIKIEMPHDTTIVDFTPRNKNVHIILLDTTRLKEDFSVYEPIRKFVQTHFSNVTSFGSTVYIDYKQNKLILRNNPRIGEFDSICFNFCKSYILDYNWKIKPVNKRHPVIIGFNFLLDNDTRKMVIEIYGIRGKKSSRLLSLEIPVSCATVGVPKKLHVRIKPSRTVNPLLA
jgi:hypothetical protein